MTERSLICTTGLVLLYAMCVTGDQCQESHGLASGAHAHGPKDVLSRNLPEYNRFASKRHDAFATLFKSDPEALRGKLHGNLQLTSFDKLFPQATLLTNAGKQSSVIAGKQSSFSSLDITRPQSAHTPRRTDFDGGWQSRDDSLDISDTIRKEIIIVNVRQPSKRRKIQQSSNNHTMRQQANNYTIQRPSKKYEIVEKKHDHVIGFVSNNAKYANQNHRNINVQLPMTGGGASELNAKQNPRLIQESQPAGYVQQAGTIYGSAGAGQTPGSSGLQRIHARGLLAFPGVFGAPSGAAGLRTTGKSGARKDKHEHVQGLPESIPGRPGIDYPTLGGLPKSRFDCKTQQGEGFYADTSQDAQCQVFWVCYHNQQDGFICPNGTVFNQRSLTCDWWFNVQCDRSPQFFQPNKNFDGAVSALTSAATAGANGWIHPVLALLSEMLQYPKVYPVLSHKSQAKNLPESAVYMTPPANLEYHDTDHKFKKFKPSLSAELHVLGKTSVQVKGGVPGIPGLDAWRVGKTTNYPSHLDKFHTNLQIPQGQKQTYKREIKEYMIQRYINHATGNHMKSRRSRQANSVNLPHAEQIQVTSGLESETAKLANAVPQTAQSKLAQLQDAVHPQNTGNNVVPPQSAAPQDFQDHPSVYKGPVASIGTADSVAFPMDGKGPALPKVKEDFNIDVHQQGINRITLKDTLPSNFPGPSNPISVMTGAKKQHSGDSAMPGSMEDNTQFSQQGGTSGSSIEPGHFNSITLSENVNLGKYYSGLPAIPSETAMSFPSNLASRNQQQSVGNMLSGPHQNNQPVFTGPNASPENQQRYGDIPAVPGHHPEHISATVNELQNQQNSMNLPRNPAEPKSNGVDNTSAQGSLLVSSGEQSQTSGQQYTGGKPSISSAPELPRSPSGMAPEEKPDRLGAAGPPAGLEYTQGQPDASRDAPAINSAIVSDSTAGQSSASGSDQAPALTNGSPRVTSQTSCAGGYGSSSNGQSETETVFKDQRSRGEQLSVKTNKNNAENLPTPQTHINSMPASHTAFDVSDKFSKRTEKSSKLPVPKKNNTGQQDKAPAPEMSQHDSNATLSIISSDANFEEAIKKPQSRADNIGSVRDGGSNSESSSLTDIKFGSEEVMIQKSKTEVLLPYYGKHVANKTKHNKEMPSILGETMGDDSFNMLPESAMVTKREENDISSQPSLNSVTRNRTLENPKDKLERDEHEQISSFSDVFSRPHSAIVTKELDSTSQLVNVKGKIPSFVSSHTQQQQSQLGDRPSISDIVDDPAALNKEMPSQSLKGVIPQQKRIEEGPVMHGKKNVQIISQSVSRIIKNPARHRSYIKDPAGMYIPELLKRPNFIGGFTAQDDPNTTPSAVSKPIQSELTENVDAKPGYSMNPTNKVLRSTKLAGPNLTNLNIFDKRLRLGDTLGDAFMSSLRGTLDAGFRYKKAGSNPVSDQTLAGSEGYVERDKKNGKEQIDIGVKTENKMKSDNVQKGSIHKLVSEMGKGLNLQGSDINSLDKDLTSTLSHTLQIVDKLLGPPPFQNRRVARSEKQSNRFRKAVRNAHKKRTQNGDERNVKANLLKSSIGMINILLVENNTRPSNHTRSPMGSAAGDIIFDLPRQHKGKHKSKMSKDKKTFKKLGPDMKITETIDVEPTNRTNRSYSDYDYDVKQLPHWMRMAYSGKKGRARVNIGNVNISKATRVVKSVDNIDVAKEPAELASATKTRNSRSGNTVLENSKNKSNGNMQSMLKTCQSRLLQSLGVNDVRSDANLDKISARAISKQNQQQTTLNKRSRFRKMVSNYEQPTII